MGFGWMFTSAYSFLSFHNSQLSQDSPEQEASKSPRGGVPGSGETSLPHEGNPQMSLHSPSSMASYSQVGRRGRRPGATAAWLSRFRYRSLHSCMLRTRDMLGR